MDNLFSVAERFGTPCFVFDEVQLARRMKAVRAIVPEDIRLCYSIKANPFLIPAMRRLVGTLEVCSPGELEICRQQGVSPDMVSAMMQLAPMLSRLQQDDDTTRLLHALRPLLSEERRQKVDRAIQMVRMIHLLPMLQESGVFSSLLHLL